MSASLTASSLNPVDVNGGALGVRDTASNSPVRSVTDTTPAGAGEGVNGAGGPVPDVAQRAARGGITMLTFQALLQSIDEKLLKAHGNQDPAMLIAEIGILTEKMQTEINENSLKAETGKSQAVLRDNDKKLKEHQAELEKAEKAQREAEEKAKRSSRIGGIFGKIFKALSYVVAAVSIVVGAALVLTGVGAAAGAVLFATGASALANNIIKDVTGKGFGGHFAKLVGGNEMWGDLGFDIGCAVLSGFTMWKSAGKIAEAGTRILGKLGVHATTIAEKTAVAAKVANRLSTTVQLSQAGMMGAQGGMNIDTAIKKKEADDASVRALRAEADAKRVQGETALQNQLVDLALGILMEQVSWLQEVLDNPAEMFEDRMRVITKNKFTA